uniref:Uncharacterized protein n=1 Tax=Rhizophora mucronata TaxID=61149 RepID=A0A2P2PH86_RHIMU
MLCMVPLVGVPVVFASLGLSIVTFLLSNAWP